MDKERFHTLPSCGHQKASERGGEGEPKETRRCTEEDEDVTMWDRHMEVAYFLPHSLPWDKELTMMKNSYRVNKLSFFITELRRS